MSRIIIVSVCAAVMLTVLFTFSNAAKSSCAAKGGRVIEGIFFGTFSGCLIPKGK